MLKQLSESYFSEKSCRVTAYEKKLLHNYSIPETLVNIKFIWKSDLKNETEKVYYLLLCAFSYRHVNRNEFLQLNYENNVVTILRKIKPPYKLQITTAFRRKIKPLGALGTTFIFINRWFMRDVDMSHICSHLLKTHLILSGFTSSRIRKISKRRQWRRSSAFIINFEQFCTLFLCFHYWLWTSKWCLGGDYPSRKGNLMFEKTFVLKLIYLTF